VQLHAFADSSERDNFSLSGVFLPGLAVCCAALILAAVVFWAWTKATRDLSERDASRIHCALLLGSLLLVLPILPALNLNVLNPGDFLHGRYTYLPLAGMMLVLATAWYSASKWRLYLVVVFTMLAVVFGVLTVRQVSAWQNDLTIFTVAHKIAPENKPVALNMARAQVQEALKLVDTGQCNAAIPVFQQVTRQFPDDWFAWAALGDCFVQSNDLPKAEQSLDRAADLSHNPKVIQELGEVHARIAVAMQDAHH
jgi:tetratricopeptide (TPR) repeat protein